MSVDIAVSYAAVILADADVEITADKLLTLAKAANVETLEPIVAQLYAKALKSADTKALLTAFNTASAGGAAAGGAGAAAGGAAGDAAAEEEKPAEEEESESDMDMGGLF